MSLVNYYKCDICDKKFKQSELYHFKRERKKITSYFGNIGYYKIKDIETKDFDMCEKCLAKITIEIKNVEDKVVVAKMETTTKSKGNE